MEKQEAMKRIYLSNNTPIEFDFTQTPRSFHVGEVSKIALHKKGEYRLIEVKKVGISTMEMVEYLASVFKIKEYEIGYAGLKDKHATTTQFITLPKYVNIKKFNNSERVTLNEVGFCRDGLRIGNLRANAFTIVLSEVSIESYTKLVLAMQKIEKIGFANYFGYQRFGALDDNAAKGKKISDRGKGSKNQRSKILLAAYQAKAFNNWLTTRLKISKDIIEKKTNPLIQKLSPALISEISKSTIPFKLLPGDLGYFYKQGKKSFENVNDINKYIKLFQKRSFHPTGVLFGSHVRFSSSIAGMIEREFVDYSFDSLRGARRDAWVFLKNMQLSYNKKTKEATLRFTLPPGSYATVVLEELKNTTLQTFEYNN